MVRYRVVIVEDDPMVTEINRTYVTDAGPFDVAATARTGREALRLITRLEPDLVLLDLFLPELDGISVLRAIRRQGLPTDAIIISASQDPKTVLSALRLGAVDYICKPFQSERLQCALQAFADQRKRLSSADALTQEQIDQWLPVLGSRLTQPEGLSDRVITDAPLPKGLTEWTLRQVLNTLQREPDPLSASETAERIGLARITVRRYLDYLVQQGIVRAEQYYKPVGRPTYRYAVREDSPLFRSHN